MRFVFRNLQLKAFLFCTKISYGTTKKLLLFFQIIVQSAFNVPYCCFCLIVILVNTNLRCDFAIFCCLLLIERLLQFASKHTVNLIQAQTLKNVKVSDKCAKTPSGGCCVIFFNKRHWQSKQNTIKLFHQTKPL